MPITIFMFIFSKVLFFINFWANLVPKSDVVTIDWNLALILHVDHNRKL